MYGLCHMPLSESRGIWNFSIYILTKGFLYCHHQFLGMNKRPCAFVCRVNFNLACIYYLLQWLWTFHNSNMIFIAMMHFWQDAAFENNFRRNAYRCCIAVRMDECVIGTWLQHTSFLSRCCLNGAQSLRGNV